VRRPFIAGNWKMNLTRAEALSLADQVVAQCQDDRIDVALCAPYVYLDALHPLLRKSHVHLGAQNMCERPAGAFTGEINGEMLLEVGCQCVILGHSERRQLFGETDEAVHRKTIRALDLGLLPIVCLGETLEEREDNRTFDVVNQQFRGSLGGLTRTQMERVVIAYEPVWAIGTGVVATPEQAEEVHADLRSLLESQYNAEVAAHVRIQYGGSVKPDNALQLFEKPNIDGALVGGASLQTDSFVGIVQAARELVERRGATT
jgi:triosephosphate isomerase (TIM)